MVVLLFLHQMITQKIMVKVVYCKSYNRKYYHLFTKWRPFYRSSGWLYVIVSFTSIWAIVLNNSTYWDVITINSHYDWENGVIAFGASGKYDDSVLIPYSCLHLNNLFSQPNTSSNLGSSDRQDFTVSVAGSNKKN